MSRPRIADVRLVARLLSEPADSVDDLALQVITELDEQRLVRAKKEPHRGVLLKAGKGLPLLVVAPFPTEKALERWAKENNINPDDVTHVVVKRPEEV